MIAYEHACHATKGARNYQEDTAIVRPEASSSASGHAASAPLDARASEPAPSGAGAAASADGNIVAVLADGMGGHVGGALASRMVCETFIKAYAEQDGPRRERLRGSLEAANSAIAGAVSANPLLSGMGSTLVGVVFGAEGVEWVSVGDSPLLLYRGGEIEPLNEDHSLGPELDRLAKSGLMSMEEARRDPRRHMLRSAVTGEEIDLVDLSRRPLQVEPGDYIILASDGLQALEMSEIERIVAAYGDDGAPAVASALIRAVEAIKDPHQDNATVVAVRPVLADG